MNDDVAAGDRVIWMLGDPWRDLRCDLHHRRRAAFLTENGTIHLIDLDEEFVARIPVSTHNVLTADGQPRALVEVLVATPCGLVTHCDPVARSQRSTRVLLVVAGLEDLDTAARDEFVARYLSWDQTPTGHPPDPCGALYCPQPRSTISPARDG